MPQLRARVNHVMEYRGRRKSPVEIEREKRKEEEKRKKGRGRIREQEARFYVVL